MGDVSIEREDIQGYQKDVIGKVVQGPQFQKKICGVLDIGWSGLHQWAKVMIHTRKSFRLGLHKRL